MISDQYDSNDFEIIDEDPDGFDGNGERKGSSCSIEMMAARASPDLSSAEKTSGKMNSFYDAVHSKREAEWYNQQEEMLIKIKDLEDKLKQKEEVIESMALQKRNDDEEQTRAYLAQLQELQLTGKTEKEKCAEYERKVCEMKVAMEGITTNKDRQIHELNKELEEQKESYKKLKEIHAELEKEMESVAEEHRSQMKAKETEIAKRSRQTNKFQKEKAETEKQLKNTIEDLQRKLDMERRQCETARGEKDKVDEELIEAKLELRKMSDEKKKIGGAVDQSTSKKDEEIRRLANVIEEMVEERNGLHGKCSRLEREIDRLKNTERRLQQQLQSNSEENERLQLTKALDALNDENEVLRDRNKQADRDNCQLKSTIKQLERTITDMNEAERKLKEEHARLNREYSKLKNEKKIKGSIPGGEEMRRKQEMSKGTSQADTQSANYINVQWYESQQGEKLLHEIFTKLKEPFPLTELSRNFATKNISLTINKLEDNKSVVVVFPRDFPTSPLSVFCNGNERSQRLVRIPSDTASISTLSTKVASAISEVACM